MQGEERYIRKTTKNISPLNFIDELNIFLNCVGNKNIEKVKNQVDRTRLK